MRIIKVETIAIQQVLKSGRLLPAASLYIQVPYAGNGWNIGCWSIPHMDVIALRSVFKTVSHRFV